MGHYHAVLHNPYWASNEIHAQVMTHRGKNMVCLAMTQDQEELLLTTIRESPYDYRLTITDGPARTHESRKDGQVSSLFIDGMYHRKIGKEEGSEEVFAF